MATQPTCAERIDEAMASREADIKAMTEQAEGTEYYGDEEALYELALSVDVYKVVKILLSWGGPSDFIEVTLSKDDEILSMSYHFQDWYDGAKRSIDEDSYLWNYAVMMLEGVYA